VKQGREFNFPGWVSGLNNIAREDLLDPRQLRKATNVDLLPGGHPRRRQGYTKVLGDGHYHSLFATPNYLVFVKDGKLCVTEDIDHVEEVAEDVRELTGVVINDEFYFSDGQTTGILSTEGRLRPLGIISPSRQPFVSAASEGGLFEGLYQVAITYLANDGRESGTGQAESVFVPEGGGISLSGIPQPEQSEVVAVRIYASDPNGENLYFRTSVPVGQTSYELGYLKSKKKLNTQFHQAMPAGDHFCFFNGRLYAAVHNTLVMSDPLNFGHYHGTDGYFMMVTAIQGLAPVDEGLFVSDSNRVYFLHGQRPGDFRSTIVHEHAAQHGTMTTVSGEIFRESLASTVIAVWWSTDGHLIAGMPDGTIQRIKEADISAPLYEAGTVAEVRREGVRQLLAVMKNPKQQGALAAKDSVDATVHRNGIEL